MQRYRSCESVLIAAACSSRPDTGGVRARRVRSPCAATRRRGSGRRSGPSGAAAGSRHTQTRSAPSSRRRRPRSGPGARARSPQTGASSGTCFAGGRAAERPANATGERTGGRRSAASRARPRPGSARRRRSADSDAAPVMLRSDRPRQAECPRTRKCPLLGGMSTRRRRLATPFVGHESQRRICTRRASSPRALRVRGGLLDDEHRRRWTINLTRNYSRLGLAAAVSDPRVDVDSRADVRISFARAPRARDASLQMVSQPSGGSLATVCSGAERAVFLVAP
jgi:hypothetical protein